MGHAIAIARHRGVRAARQSDVKVVACLLAFYVAAIGVLGTIDVKHGTFGGLFHFGGERNVTALSSAALLAGVAGLALLLSDTEEPAASRWRHLAGLFAFMAVDEAMWVHEYLQLWTGIDWEVLYLPVVAVAAVVGLRAISMIWPDRLVRGLFIGGTVSWFLSLVLEAMRSVPFFWIGVGEEEFEMAGTSMFVLSLLLLVQQRFAPAQPRT